MGIKLLKSNSHLRNMEKEHQIEYGSPDYHRIVEKHKVTKFGQYQGWYNRDTGEKINSFWYECECGQTWNK